MKGGRTWISLVVSAVAALIFVVWSRPDGGELFIAERCIDCHTFGGEGGKVGPDLTNVVERRGEEWVRRQIINPRIHNRQSIMPSFSYLSDREIRALIDHLSVGG